MHSELLKSVEIHTTKILESLSSKLCYHNLNHTRTVVEGVELLSVKCRLSAHEREIALIAAWFHDTGFSIQYNGHEEASLTIARKFLSSQNCDERKIRRIEACIESTCMPQSPADLLQMVLCDADLWHLSKSDFLQRLDILRREWEYEFRKYYSDKKWYELNIQFLQNHEYFTHFGKNQFQKGKDRNMGILQKLLNNHT